MRRAVAIAALAAALAPVSSASAQVLLPPPGGGIYHAAYPEFRGSEDHVQTRYVNRFERLAGRGIAWAYFSNNWLEGIRFPQAAMSRIRAAGTTPFVRLMARSGFKESGPDKRYTLQRIIDGDFDGELAACGKRIPSSQLFEK